MHLKVCGATQADEIEPLATAGADLVGLWHGIPDGHAELTIGALAGLAAVTKTTGRIRPVLVTMETNVDTVCQVTVQSRIPWIQLHGYQQPGMVRALKSARQDLTVVKAIHVRGRTSVERSLIGAYERSGVDMFLFDALTADGRVGSTAHPLDPQVVADLAERVSRPFLLAGGLTMDNAARFRLLAGHPRFLGIDVDSGARGPDGRIDPERVAAIRRSWTAMEAAR